MGIECRQSPTPQPLQLRMLHDAFQQQFAQSLTAMRFQHEYVGDVGEGSKIADYPRKAHLNATAVINANAYRQLDLPHPNHPRNPFGPITFGGKIMDDAEIPTPTLADNE